MVLCAVCSASRRPMGSLSADQMKAFEALVSQFANLEPLIKSHTILMCPPCLDQIEMVRKFQAAAAAGVKRLLSFLQGHDQPTSDPNKTVMVTIKQEPVETCFEAELELKGQTQTLELPSQNAVSEDIVIKCKSGVDFTNKLATANQTQEMEMVTETVKENKAKRKSTHLETVLNNNNEIVTFKRKPAKVLTNAKTEVASASTSKLALRAQINSSASALLKCNIYDPDFLNKYFSESRDATQPETSNKETNMAKFSENAVTTANGLNSNRKSSAPLSVAREASATTTTKQANSQKQKNYRTKQIVSCSICGATFLSKRFMTIHVRAKHAPKEPPVKLSCDVCGVTSQTRAGLKRHIASVHNAQEEAKFGCDECTRKFPMEDRLKEHKVKEHMQPNKADSISQRVVTPGVSRTALHAQGILKHIKLAQLKGKRKGGNSEKKGNTGKKGNGEKRG